MFKEILTEDQQRLLTLIKLFRQDFYLAGGTAIALQIGHRRSIDFDLFSGKPLKTIKIINIIKRDNHRIDATLEESREELTIIVDGIKMTFLEYPFDIRLSVSFNDIIMLPDLLSLAATKAYSLGRRSKWKDYIDLYFILRDYFPLKDISKKAKEIFGGGFNERLFREQLCYFEDIDFSEGIEFVREAVDDKVVREFLTSVSTAI
ncbi:MAG: nucleotidyl transferase AbiEii/AbiGii toxin family protein [Nitrospirae bacterium]|nr:nucleotidyl transferase AbiEii/AbiGii toxin family protein [Nitrospirota bacterium]